MKKNKLGEITVKVNLIAPAKELKEAGIAIKELKDFSVAIASSADRKKYNASIQKILNLFEKIESKEGLKS